MVKEEVVPILYKVMGQYNTDTNRTQRLHEKESQTNIFHENFLNAHRQNASHVGLDRVFWSAEHLLLSQRSRVWFSLPTSICNSSSREIQCPLLASLGLHACGAKP